MPDIMRLTFHFLRRSHDKEYRNDYSEINTVSGGAANVAINTAYLLSHKGYNVYFFSGTGTPDKFLMQSPGIEIISTGQNDLLHDKNRIRIMMNGIYNFKSEKEFRKLLSRLNKEGTVIHVHAWAKVLSCSVFKVASDMGFKVFITIHDYMLVCPNINIFHYPRNQICEIKPMSMKCFLTNCDKRHYYHKVWRFIRAYVQNRIIRKASHTSGIGYIFISEFSKRQLLRRIPAPKNQFFVKNPIYFTNRFRVEAENNYVFIFIGRTDPEKGIKNFCEAVHNTGVKGVVIGDGILRDELEAKYPEIEFTGWLNKEQIHERIKEARCLIFPSLCYEVSPLTPLEVEAYGIPVIASDCSAASDNASFVYHSQKELEDLIMKVNSEDIKQLSTDTFNNFDESSTINYADNLLKVYNTLLMTE